MAVGRGTTERRCQPVESKVAKPVRASGAGTAQKEAWPKAVGTCQAAQSCLCGVAPGGGGECLPPQTTPCREPCRPSQPGPNSTLKSCQTTPVSDKYNNGQRTWMGPSPEGPGSSRQGTRGLAASLHPPPPPWAGPALSQPAQHEATDPLTRLGASVLRTPHRRRKEKP